MAFWLVPAADAKAYFESLINDLAARLEAPAFEPHVTLQGAEMEEGSAIELLDDIAAVSAPLQLDVDGVECSEKYTKTLYVQFRASEEASGISDAVARAVGRRSGYKFDPHLSLLYKTMPEEVKKELARETQIPFARVSFDAVKLLSVPTAIKAPQDVHAWRIIAERALTGRSR